MTSLAITARSVESRFRRFVLTVLLCVAPFVVVASMCAWLLYQSDEFAKARDVAAYLQDHDAIYGTGVHDVRRQIHFEILRARTPEIIALGSSRALSFRQEFFTRPFASAGQALTTLEQGMAFIEAMQDLPPPEVVIFAVDFWWFLQEGGGTASLKLDGEPRMTVQKLFRPLELIWEGDVTVGELAGLLLPTWLQERAPGPERLGLLAKLRGVGIRPDGSLLVGTRLTDKGLETHRQFAEAFADPNRYIASTPRYQPDQTINSDRVTYFVEMIARLQQRGSYVIVVLLPLAPPIYEAFDLDDGHRYILEIGEALSGVGDESYDLQNPARIGANSCEFADIHHAGDAAYMKLLRQIAAENPHSVLREYLDLNALDEAISANPNRTMARFGTESEMPVEQDFLSLGCVKA